MLGNIYFALSSGLAARERLPDYAKAVFAEDFDRAYQLVDHHGGLQGKDTVDYAGVLAMADASMLLECDEDAEEAFRIALRLIRHSDDQLRVVSCRNTGWQSLLRDRYSAAAGCFSRMAEDDGATWHQRMEGMMGLALVHHQLGQQDAADEALQSARAVATERNDAGWLATLDLIVYEFAVQAGIRCSNRMLEHAFWQSAEVGAAMLHHHGGRDGWAADTMRDAAMPAMIQRRAEYLGLLRRMADGDRTAIDPLMSIIGQSRRMGSRMLMQTKVEVVLAALNGEQYDVAGKVFDQICNRETSFGARRWNFDYLYCRAKMAAQRGDAAGALKHYTAYMQDALRCLRTESPGVRRISPTTPAASRASDDVSARLSAKYRRAYHYIIDNIERSDLTTREVAAHINVTERALQLAFKSAVGMSPSSVIRRLRLEGIRSDLLDEGRGPSNIIDTASRWGIRSRSALVKGYRKQFNEAPSETIWR